MGNTPKKWRRNEVNLLLTNYEDGSLLDIFYQYIDAMVPYNFQNGFISQIDNKI